MTLHFPAASPVGGARGGLVRISCKEVVREVRMLPLEFLLLAILSLWPRLRSVGERLGRKISMSTSWAFLD
jgi:hypothetical protein